MDTPEDTTITNPGDGSTGAATAQPWMQLPLRAFLTGQPVLPVAVTLSAGARIAPPVTGRTLLPPEPTGYGATARQRSRERYGRDRAEVEAAIRARHDGQPGPGGTGRREARP